MRARARVIASRRALTLLCVPACLAAAVLLTWPLARELGLAIPTVVPLPDALMQAFILHWDLRTLFTHPLGVFDAPIFHPEPNTLTYMDSLLGETIVAAPVAVLTRNHAVVYNSVVLFSFVSSGWATYRLVRLLGVSGQGSFLCGLLYAFGPYRWCNMANLNLLQTELIPLGLFFAFRYLRDRRRGHLLATGATLALQSYFSWYYTFYLATALLLLAACEIAKGRLRWRECLGPPWLAAGLVTLALVLPGLAPYLAQRASMPGFGRTIGMAAYASADLLDYLKINAENRTLGWLPTGDQPYFPGLVAAALAFWGWRAAFRRGPVARGTEAGSMATAARRAGPPPQPPAEASYFALLGLSGLVLSLGPVLRVAGHRLWVPLPYAVLFYAVPGFSSMRAPGRYAVLVLMATVVLAGWGFDGLRRRLERSGGAALLFPAALAATLVTAWSVPWPLVPFPKHDQIPSVYAWLERQPGDFAVLEVPVPLREADEGQREVTRQIFAIYHQKPLVDGASGFVSPSHRIFRMVMQRFPEADAIRAARERGTRILIAHYGDWPPAVAGRLRLAADRAPGLRRVTQFGDDVAYEVVRPPG